MPTGRCPAYRSAVLLLLLAAALAAPAACKKRVPGPGTALAPTDEAHASLIASVTIGPMDRTLGRVAALAARLDLPFSTDATRRTLAARAAIPEELVAALDGSRSLGIAVVAGEKEKPPLLALAASAKNPAAALRLVAALGVVEETNRNARRVRRPDGAPLWVLIEGSRVVAGDSLQALAHAGPLAVEAQKDLPQDVAATVFADALARWQGTDVRSGLAIVRRRILDQSRDMARAGQTPAQRASLEAALDVLFDRLTDTAAVTLAAVLEPDRGFRLGASVRPRPNSAFARGIRTPTPYRLDPGLLRGSDPIAGVVTVGPSQVLFDLQQAIVAAQARAGVPGAAELASHFQAIRLVLDGAQTTVLRAAGGTLRADAAYGLRDGVAGAAALDAVAAVTSIALGPYAAGVYGPHAPRVKTTREGTLVRIEATFPPRSIGAAMLKALLGAPALGALATASGRRLLVATEPGARARLDALASLPASAAATGPGADVAALLADTAGHDGATYLDFLAMLRPLIALAQEHLKDSPQAGTLAMAGALPGLLQTRAPILFSHRGGDALELELRVPLVTMVNVVGLVRPFLGMSGVLGKAAP